MHCAASQGLSRGAVLALVLALCGGCRDDGDDDGASGDSSGTAAGTSGSSSASETAADETAADGTAADMGPWSSLAERPCPDDSFLTYENFGGPFMLTFCTTCHASRLPADMRQGSPLEVDFDGIDDIRAQADRIWIRAADQNLSMPPVGPPSEQERTRLGEWLACGAPTAADLGM